VTRQDDAQKFIGARRDPLLHTEYEIALHGFETAEPSGGGPTAAATRRRGVAEQFDRIGVEKMRSGPELMD